MCEQYKAHTLHDEVIPSEEISNQEALPENPLVSVKMLAYNHEPYIRRAIEGVVDQQLDFAFELVIGEDCSSDGTRAIVLEYQKKYPQIIRVITSIENVGAVNNSWRTEKACRGKYIAWCEGDDHWHYPEKLKQQVAFLEAHEDYGMVHGNARLLYVESGKMVPKAFNVPNNLQDYDSFVDIMTGRRPVLTLTVCARKTLVDKVVAENPECTDKRYKMGDTQRWLEMSRLSKVKYFDEVVATHNMLPESATRSKDPDKTLRFALSGQELLCHYLKKYDVPEPIAGQIRREAICNVLSMTYRAINFAEAKRQIAGIRNITDLTSIKCFLFYAGSKNKLCKCLARPLLSMVYLIDRYVAKVMQMVRPSSEIFRGP